MSTCLLHHITLQGAGERLVLDLRNNGGGLFPAGVELGRLLLNQEDIVFIADSQQAGKSCSCKCSQEELKHRVLKQQPILSKADVQINAAFGSPLKIGHPPQTFAAAVTCLSHIQARSMMA
eukprot:scaffold98368_cov17-Tisochrysis_lutea.AAC.1